MHFFPFNPYLSWPPHAQVLGGESCIPSKLEVELSVDALVDPVQVSARVYCIALHYITLHYITLHSKHRE